MNSFDIKLAKTFMLTCQEGSLRGAAERLSIEPSSVSRQITHLETQIGMALLERSRRGALPTEAGERLLVFLQQQASDLEVLRADFDALQGLQRGQVRLAIGDGFISDFTSNALPSFRNALPGISFNLQSGATEQIMQIVKSDQAHFGFVFNPSPDPAVRVLQRKRQPMAVLFAPGFDLGASEGPLTIQQLAKLPMALPMANFGVGALLRETEAAYGLRFHAVVEANSLAALRNFVREGLGVTLLPAFVVAHELASGVVKAKPLDIPELNRGEAAIVTRLGRRLPEAASRLVSHSARSMRAFAG